MDINKFKRLMDLVINEDHDQARELFHEITVEKSREIFESQMFEDDMEEEDLDEGMGGQVGDLLDEINAEEEGMTEEDESDIEFDDKAEEDGEDFTHDLEADHDEGDEHEEAIIRIEDKLDQLMAEFEDIMGGGDDMAGDDMDFGDEDDDMNEMGYAMDEDDEAMMEAVQLQKVSVTHGDNGVQTKSPVTFNSGKAGMDSSPVNFSGGAESHPTGPKGPSNAYSKGETSVKGAGSFKNAPGQKSQDLTAAPKAVTKDGSANDKSPVAESRRSARRPIR
jgi:hypothetical protein